jgi:hypothetical protein
MDDLLSPTDPAAAAVLAADDAADGLPEPAQDQIEVKVYFCGAEDELQERIFPFEM